MLLLWKFLELSRTFLQETNQIYWLLACGVLYAEMRGSLFRSQDVSSLLAREVQNKIRPRAPLYMLKFICNALNASYIQLLNASRVLPEYASTLKARSLIRPVGKLVAFFFRWPPVDGAEAEGTRQWCPSENRPESMQLAGLEDGSWQ